MNRKIGIDFEKSVERELSKKKIVKVKVGGDEYEVRIKYRMSDLDRERLIDLFMELLVLDLDETVAISLAVLNVATDIEFPEEIEGKINIFTGLYNVGELENLLNQIPKTIFKDVENIMLGLSNTMQADFGKQFVDSVEIGSEVSGD